VVRAGGSSRLLDVQAKGARRGSLGERHLALAPPTVTGVLLEDVCAHSGTLGPGAAGAGDGEELGGHDGEVMILLVLVGPGAEVDLRDRVEAVATEGVDERGDLDAVPGGDRERLHERTTRRPLSRERLDHP